MTRTNAFARDLCTVTLTESQWSTIRIALLCISIDCRTAGKSADAGYYMNAYNTLKRAMGMDD